MDAKDALEQRDWQRRVGLDPRWAGALLPVAILAATFLAYVPTLALGFVFDDHILIETNDSIRSWRYFPTYFASHIWSFHYPHLLANYYRPLFLTWLRLNDALFGLHPWGWHLTSVLAHVAVTYLVYRLCLRLTGDGWVAGAAGLLFGLHPVHVEAVADITSIQEPLSSLFILGAILTFCRSREPGPKLRWLAAGSHGHPARVKPWPKPALSLPKGWPCHKDWLAASFALTAAALLSKESGLVIPILICGFAWVYGEDSGREVASVEGRTRFIERLRSALVASIPFWAVVLIYLPLRLRALKGFAHVVTPLSLSKEIFTIPSVLLFYLRLLVWPSGLSCYYDTPYISTPSWHDFVLPAALLACIAGALVVWYWRTRLDAPREAKAIAFACLWMTLTLLPVLNFRFLPESEIAHDRYVYLPSVGFVILVAMALRRAMTRVAARSSNRPAWALLGALAVSGVMGMATARQSLFWSDDLTLNHRAHEIAPHNVSATTSLAAAVGQHGMDGAAMALYQQALAIRPEFWQANVNLGYLYYAHGNFPEAARFFARACNADPTDGDQFLYLGMALLRMGRFTEAEEASRTALLVRPQGKNYHLGLGMVLKAEGKLPEAKQEIEAELSEDGQNAQARALLEDITREMNAPAGKASPERVPKGSPQKIM
ncbi:MAG TPA: tetratricopeptide repeat protein [Terriglobia bacterium]|nr:tetratricopeptide repeat protein [Terriglobia bacterium]